MDDLIKATIRSLEDQLEDARLQLEECDNNPHKTIALAQTVSNLIQKLQETRNLLTQN